MKKKEFKSWWIIGLLIPFLGLIIYFTNKGMNKNAKSNLFTSTIIGFGLWLLIGLSFLIKANEPVVVEPKEYTVAEWLVDTQESEPVVTVIGMTTCGFCQNYKPVITKLAEKYGFNLFFYELEELKDEYTTLKEELEVLYDQIEKNKDIIDEIVTVSDDSAYEYTRIIAKAEGSLVGISSGAALAAACQIAKRAENNGKNIVVILPDSGSRYLSSGVFE